MNVPRLHSIADRRRAWDYFDERIRAVSNLKEAARKREDYLRLQQEIDVMVVCCRDLCGRVNSPPDSRGSTQ